MKNHTHPFGKLGLGTPLMYKTATLTGYTENLMQINDSNQ